MSADNISISLEGVDDFFKQLEKKGKSLGLEGRKALQKGAQIIVNEAKANLKRNGSISSTKLHNSGKVQKVASNPDAVDAGFFSSETKGGYAYFVEYGRRSGKMPPPEDLVEWVRKKNLHNRALDSAINFLNGRRRTRTAKYTKADLLLSAAWGVAKGIAKKGTRPHPFFGPAVDKHKQAVVDAIAEAINKETK